MFFKNYSESWIIFIYQFFSYFVTFVEILENISLKNFLGNIQDYCARYLMNIFLSVHTISFKNFLIHRYSNLTRTRGNFVIMTFCEWLFFKIECNFLFFIYLTHQRVFFCYTKISSLISILRIPYPNITLYSTK